jgi:predicted ATPase
LQVQILEHASSLRLSPRDGRGIDRVPASDPDERPGAGDVAPARLAGLPVAPTATIGRREEVEAVCRLLGRGEARLVTLTGTGGVGKTRLALEIARELEPAFPDRACWVELAGVARAEDVAAAIARALVLTPVPGERAGDALRRYLQLKRLLLVLDNFEHVLDAADLVAGLHGGCRGLSVLVTSREPLHLAAEHRLHVLPLQVPAVSSTVSVEEVESTDASALFVAASRRHDHRFSPTAANAASIASICARLDGLPLALELAAAHTATVGPGELASGLEHILGDLASGPRDAPERHRTLCATIEWSFRLLERDAQRAFARLAVFAGGATVDAAESVTGATVATIQTLLAKSLLERRPRPDGSTRLVMLETVRRYALGRLAEEPDHEAVRRAHSDYLIGLAERLVPRLLTHAESGALAAIDEEIDNLRAALDWALEQAPESALRLAGLLGEYWYISGDLDGLCWLDAALRAAGERAPAADRAGALIARARQLYLRLEHPTAREPAAEALELYEQAGNDAGISDACNELATIAMVLGDGGEARRLAEAACEHARRAGDGRLLGRALGTRAVMLPNAERPAALDEAAELFAAVGNYRDLAMAYSNAGWIALKEDQTAEAIALLDVALETAEHAPAPHVTVVILGNMGLANLQTANLDRARAAFDRQLRLCFEHGFRYGAHEALLGFAALAIADGDLDRGARLAGAACAMGWPTAEAAPIDDRIERNYFEAARARFGTVAWRRLERAGACLPFEEAVAYALANSSAEPDRDDRAVAFESSVPSKRRARRTEVEQHRGRPRHLSR